MIKLNGFSSRLWVIFLLCITIETSAQGFAFPPSDEYRPDRLKKVVVTETVIGVAASVGLYYLWYRKFPRSRFHFFNDNREWLQVDKVGHATSAYTIAVVQNDLMRWCGLSPNKSIVIGSASALAYMSIIEVLDGFSKHWGFSKGDMLANIVGTTLFAAQQKWWGQQRATLKFSFHTTSFAQFNPSELGNNWQSRLMKDYNGQTYWLSFNIRSFLPAQTRFPQWLNIAAGYGAEGMTGANDNPTELNGKPIPSFQRTRQFYIAPDADLFRIHYSGNFLNNAAYVLKLSKVPAPALEWNTAKKWKFHPVYY